MISSIFNVVKLTNYIYFFANHHVLNGYTNKERVEIPSISERIHTYSKMNVSLTLFPYTFYNSFTSISEPQ